MSAGQDAQVVGIDILQNQAEEFLVQVTTADALKNDANINDIRLDANHLAQFIGTIYADPDAFDSQSYWQAIDKMYIAPGGQYVNREDDISTIFAPNFVGVNEQYITDLNLSAYLDSIAPAILESDNNTGAVYLIHRDEFTRLYPNIGLGFIVSPDYKATDDIFYAAGTPENNPERDVVWTPVYDDPAGQGLLVSAIAPIYINEDEFVGVIGIDLGLTGLAANIEEASTIANGYSFLMNDEGLALALPQQGYEDIFEAPLSSGTSGSGSDLSNLSSSFTPVIEQMMRGETGFQTIEANGKNLFVAYAPLPSTGWVLANVVEAENMLQVVDVLQEEIETSTQSLVLTRIIPISLALMLIAIIIGLVLTNRLIAPIHKLAVTAALVGDGDWDQVEAIAPETYRNDEIGVLATTFQSMTGQLKALVTGLESRVTARTQDLNLAAEIGRDISQIRDLDEVLKSSVERIRSRFDLYYVQIYLTNDYSTGLELTAATGSAGEHLLAQGHKLAIDAHSINGLSALEKRTVIVSDTAQSPLFKPNPSLPYTRSEMAIPLLLGESVRGVLNLQSTLPGGLTEANLPAFEALAGQLAIALGNASLFREQERLTDALKANTRRQEENTRFLDSVIENLPLMLFVKDATDLRFLRWNKAGAALMGRPAEAFIGKTDYDFYPEDEAAFLAQTDRNTLQKGVLVDIPEEPIQTSDKGIRLLHTIKVPIMDAEGTPQYLLGISQDITEQKEAEHQLAVRVKELNLLNEIGRKTDEQPDIAEFLTFIAERIPSGMQHTGVCRAAITLEGNLYGDADAINLPCHIVEGLRLEEKLVGQIVIAYTEDHVFLNEESAMIGDIGRRITNYIINQRLVAQVQATAAGLQTVAEVGTAISTTLEPRQQLQNIVDLTKPNLVSTMPTFICMMTSQIV
ncbi:MAG: PAS domain-containing protein [Chloroflexi bacterium]|nr:PAS domain-containing protein [Chloroflexota bacterium]